MQCRPFAFRTLKMSLNRYEQAIFNYWTKQPDELRHWRGKVAESAQRKAASGEVARELERDLWDYLAERSPHVPQLRELAGASLPRVSFLNLAEHVIRLWGPPLKSKPPGGRERGVG